MRAVRVMDDLLSDDLLHEVDCDLAFRPNELSERERAMAEKLLWRQKIRKVDESRA